MPLYDFLCPCGHTFEATQTLEEVDDEDEVLCPKCQQVAQRLISAQRVIHGSVKDWNVPLNQ